MIMPKMKSNRSLQKRIKVTGTGKLKRKSPGAGHLKSAKSNKQLRNFRGDKDVAPGFAKGFRQLLGKKK
jgi:large subunit ribosomal protein L35